MIYAIYSIICMIKKKKKDSYNKYVAEMCGLCKQAPQITFTAATKNCLMLLSIPDKTLYSYCKRYFTVQESEFKTFFPSETHHFLK